MRSNLIVHENNYLREGGRGGEGEGEREKGKDEGREEGREEPLLTLYSIQPCQHHVRITKHASCVLLFCSLCRTSASEAMLLGTIERGHVPQSMKVTNTLGNI